MGLLMYALVYFAGYYGAHLCNRALRRVLFTSLRVTGLVLVTVAASLHCVLIARMAPSGASSFVVGQVAGELAIGPALVVLLAVALETLWKGRKQ